MPAKKSVSLDELWQKKKVVIDVHCHTFNASDLTVRGFVKSSILYGEDPFLVNLRPFANALADFARFLSLKAPEYPAENKELDKRLFGRLGIFGMAGPAIEPAPKFAIDGKPSEDLLGNVEQALKVMESSTDPEHQAFIREFHNRTGGQGARGLGLERRTRTPMASSIASGWQELQRLIAWIDIFVKYRFEITSKIIKIYSEDHGKVDLFTPALVDYQHWYNEKTDTSLPDQMKLMDKNIRLHAGKVHAFYPFDPFREVIYKEHRGSSVDESSLENCKEAITKHGFIGVKLYPPMGFAAISNADLDFAAIGRRDSEFGKSLDKALLELYDFCLEQDLPLMAHCSDSASAFEGFSKRAAPKYWKKLLESKGLKNLRLNLAHFGGESELNNPGGWTEQIGELFEFPNVYADIGHWAGHFTNINDLMDQLEVFYNKFPNTIDRIMYASDWLILAREKSANQYFEVLSKAYLSKFGQEMTLKFLGENAARFLNLYPDSKNRLRIESYYRQHDLTLPDWLSSLV